LIYILQGARLDDIDLQIIRLLARDSRTPYKSIAADVGITQGAAKKRINKMLSNGVIQRFVVLINPIIFGYEKLCILIVKNIDKTTKEQDILVTKSLHIHLQTSYLWLLRRLVTEVTKLRSY
jgi:DNA-binding Lrp family transcriptional regulator